MWAGISAHFRHVTVVGRERFPRRGATLLVSNHPSTWSDVLLLYGMLGRRFHFLAEPGQFHPWPRALLIRGFGTLPVYLSDSSRDATERNEETFRRCRAHFDRGEAVAIFPEGISWIDRSLMPLRRGAARLALSYACRRGGESSFALIPVALRYSDRVAFRSDVTLCVGEPIARSELETEFGSPDARAVERLTARLAETLRRLGRLADDARAGRLLGVLEPVAAARGAGRDVEIADLLVRAIASLKRGEPERHARLERLARAHDRARRALGVSEIALAEPAPRSARRTALERSLLSLAAVPALAGAAIHAVPVIGTRLALRIISYAPSQVAFARITSGFFLTLGTYAVLALILALRFHASAALIVATLVACATLGAVSVAYWDRLRPILERRRVSRLARRHPGLVARARRSRVALGAWIDTALRDAREDS
ncbi:MAG TPA: 1-acyl-sn-glycerol-3-phosphate acyltransferase [Candidatus Eisenbacteria bacterium]|nr:1-acyl-sn-glycerol-3-phosphate acyltransferase [Candidatus Eisenbacteria bacterium]